MEKKHDLLEIPVHNNDQGIHDLIFSLAGIVEWEAISTVSIDDWSLPPRGYP